MGHYICNKNKLIIYDAPKTGGTTLRSWFYYSLNGKYPENINWDTNKKYLTGATFKKKYNQVNFIKYPNTYKKICIYRDPIDRFKSCYNDKIIREGKWQNIPGMKSPHDIDSFFEGIEKINQSLKWKIKLILGLNKGSWKNYINFHFESLTYHYGKTQNYYDEIYNINDLNQKVKPYLEKLWKSGRGKTLKVKQKHIANQGKIK